MMHVKQQQMSDMQSERMKKQEAYWLDVFSGEVPVLDMPTDYGSRISSQQHHVQRAFALHRQAFQLFRQLRPDDKLDLSDLESLIGMFVGTLAIRTNPVGEKTFREYVQEVKEHTLGKG
jgi:iturin family lipopeptide synthetase B